MAAEAALSSIAFKASKTGLQRNHCIWGAKEDLTADLISLVQKIQDVIHVAESKQDESAAIKDWIERLTSVLYEADDLFDEIETDNLCKTQEGNKMVKQVRALLNPFVPHGPSFTIAKRLKLLTQSLRQIYDDSLKFHFEKQPYKYQRSQRDIGSFVDPLDVIGREDDKTSILALLFDDSTVGTTCPDVIAVVGILGIGKTTLAQLIYNDPEVIMKFKSRWWASLSAAAGFTQVVGKIFESITKQSNEDYTIDQQEGIIREILTPSGEYLLILDDVWYDTIDQNDWLLIMKLLTSLGAARTKIIVTARSSSIPRSLDIDERHIYRLNGISDDKSWELFKGIAFTPDQENDLQRVSLGREIVNKCANVPLAIKCFGHRLHINSTIQEWESVIKEDKLIGIIRFHDDIFVLEDTYDRLSSSTKHFFAYCSVFPKGHLFLKKQFIYLWVALGCVKCEDDNKALGEAGQCFMELVNISIFEEIEVDYHGEIISCKMHELFHDLAQHLAGIQTVMQPEGLKLVILKNARHVSLEGEIDNSWSIHPELLEADQLRSLLVFGNSCSSLVLDQQAMKFRFLRALDLHALNLGEVPCSIGELKQLRYLNLSQNIFPSLPDSITMLVNLLFLDISSCRHLQSLPDEFRRLINLRHLDISYCDSLWHMPPRFGELTSIVQLSDFKVSKHGVGKSSGLDELAKLNLRGKLEVTFDQKRTWRKEELMLKCNHIPERITELSISDYPGMELLCMWKETGNGVLYNLQHLVLIRCGQVKHLPPLNCLPDLRSLRLYHLPELEYLDDNDFMVFYPSLQRLELVKLPKLKQWSRDVEAATARNIDSLLCLDIKYCYCLKSMPGCPSLQRLCLEGTSSELVTQLLPTCSSPSDHSSTPLSSLQDITINWCSELKCFPGDGLTAIRKLDIRNCTSLEELQLGSHDLQEITIRNCPALSRQLKEDEEKGVNWHFLKYLRLLNIDEIPEETAQSPTEDQRVVGRDSWHYDKWMQEALHLSLSVIEKSWQALLKLRKLIGESGASFLPKNSSVIEKGRN